MNECPYCDAFEKGCFEFEKKNNLPSKAYLKNRILYETKNFIVFPTVGQIVEGYLLIASKKHFLGMGQIPKRQYSELNFICKKVRNILTEEYTSPLFFEHGVISEVKKGGCCITHAHFHAIPVKIDILHELVNHFEYQRIKSLDSLKKQFDKGIPYFFYESNYGERYLFEIPEIVPSQYIRKVIAVKIGKPERWDWKSCLGIVELLRTIEKLKGKFVS